MTFPDGLIGNGNYALPQARHGINLLLPVTVIERGIFTTGSLKCTQFQQPLRCALDVGKTMPGMIMVQCGHKTMPGFEGNYIGARPRFLLKRRIQSRLDGQGQQGPFGWVAMEDPTIVMLVQNCIIT